MRQRLPPDFSGFEDVGAAAALIGACCGLAAAATFFGLRISLFECCWPLAMADLSRVRGRVASSNAACAAIISTLATLAPGGISRPTITIGQNSKM